jgi:hypothetical protein
LQKHFPTTILLQNLSTSLYTYFSLSLYAGGVHEKKNQKQEWRKMGRRFRLSQPNNPPRRSFRLLKKSPKKEFFSAVREKEAGQRDRERQKKEMAMGGDGASTSAKELQRMMRGAREEEERL